MQTKKFLICRPNHDINHNIIKYNQKNYICHLHNEALIKYYCTECTRNICFACQEHNNHNTIFLGDLIPDINEKNKILKEMRELIDKVNLNFKDIIKQLNEFKDIINKYYYINTIIYKI